MLAVFIVIFISRSASDNRMLPCFFWSILLNYYKRLCI